MKINHLWKYPFFSQDTLVNAQMNLKGLTLTITCTVVEGNKRKIIRTIFDPVMCHKYTQPIFTVDWFDSYDKLVEIEDSDWLRELREMNTMDFDFWKLKHFAVFFDDYGLYQVIAGGVKTEMEECDVE